MKIILATNQFQTIQSYHVWKKIWKNKIFWSFQKNSPYLLNEPHIQDNDTPNILLYRETLEIYYKGYQLN